MYVVYVMKQNTDADDARFVVNYRARGGSGMWFAKKFDSLHAAARFDREKNDYANINIKA